MKQFSNRSLTILIPVVLFFFSCMKDKGNYTYHTVNDPVIVKGIDSLYMVDVRSQSLIIDPIITTPDGKAIDTSLYTYQWNIDQQLGFAEDYPSTNPLSRSLRLEIKREDMVNTLREGTARGYSTGAFKTFYRVTDKKTGVFKDTYFKIVFGNVCFKGWLLLCEQENGSSRLGMISAIFNDSLINDVLAETGSAFPTTGKPRFIAMDYQYRFKVDGAGDHPFIGTSGNFAVLGADTLEYKVPRYDLRNYIADFPATEDFSTARFYSSGYLHYLNNNGNIYSVYEYYSGTFKPVNFFNGTKFRASEQMAVYYSQEAMVFNEDTRTFLRNPGNTFYCLELPPGTLFDFSTKQQLRYMEFAQRFNGGEIFAILDSTSKINLARFSSTGNQSYYKEILAPDIDKASHFAVDDLFGYIFYSVGAKLYQYNMLERKATLIKDYGNNKITLLKNSKGNRDMFGNAFENLVVCTYNEGDPQSGSMDLFTPPNLNGQISLVKSFTKTGKIIDVAYK